MTMAVMCKVVAAVIFSKLFKSIAAVVLSLLLFAAGGRVLASDITQTNAPRKPLFNTGYSIADGGQFAAPPGAERSHYHQGVDLGMDNTDLYAPTDGRADFVAGAGYGYFIMFYPDSSVDADGQCVILLGDLDGALTNASGGWGVDPDLVNREWGPDEQQTLIRRKEFKAGDVIATIHSQPSNSTGPHVHLEYWREGWKQGTDENGLGGPSLEDPMKLLNWLGIDVGNYQFNNRKIDQSKLTFASMANSLGNFFARLLKYFHDESNGAYSRIFDISMSLLLALCLFDLCLPIILSGMVISPAVLIRKIIKYTALIGFMYFFPKFVNDILIGFASSMAQTAAGDSTVMMANLQSSQLLLQKVASLVAPFLDRIDHFGIIDYWINLPQIFVVYFCSLIIIVAYAFFAMYVVFVLLEFYISAGLAIAVVPFGALGLTKFTTESAIGHLVSCAIKYFFLSFFLFLTVTIIQNADPVGSFTGGNLDIDIPYTGSGAIIGTNDDGSMDYSKLEGHPGYQEVIQAAKECGISPSLALAIYMQESSGGLNTDNGTGTRPYNIMQVDPDNSIEYVPPAYKDRLSRVEGMDHNWVDMMFDVDSSYLENARAGMAILYNKIAYANGDLIEGLKLYNGGGDPNYLQNVNKQYFLLTGHMLPVNAHMSITAEQIKTFFSVAVNLVAIVLVVYFCISEVTGNFTGPIKL